MIKIFFHKKVACPWSAPAAGRIASVLARQENKLKGEAEVVVVGDKEIKKLNERYRRKNKVTDVLSFAWQEDNEMKSDSLGQVYICYSQVVRQAKRFGVSAREEFIRILTHGLLHLVGYEHQTKAEEKKMFDLQEKIVLYVITRTFI